MKNTNENMLEDFLDKLNEKSRTNLLPSLLKAQELFGYISENTASRLGEVLKVPLADIYGVIEFYSLLYSKPTAKTVIRICTSPLCSLKGSEKIKKALLTKLDLKEGVPSADGLFMVESVHCLGLCDHAPAALVNESAVCDLNEDSVDNLIQGIKSGPENNFYSSNPVITKRFGKIDPLSIEDFIREGGFQGFFHALTFTKNELIYAVKASGLKGRGGAGYPTGLKEQGTFKVNDPETYVVCNADESEPGTFKDRIMLSRDPFSVLEGILITAYIVGAKKGYIYIRGEYSEAHDIFTRVIESAEKAGYLGDNIQGTGLNFNLEIRSGAGAYICGEETALFESIEGKRGYPRNKPPFPIESGLFGKPTIINNVETFSYLAQVISDKKRVVLSPNSPSPSGTKLFCLSGDVERPGMYELPFGTKLSEVINDWGGGVSSGGGLGSVILGGASGSFVPEKYWDVPLDQKSLKEVGLAMGSGVIMVFDKSRDIMKVLSDITQFFSHESCGKCYPCQQGTQYQKEIISRIEKGSLYLDDFQELEDIGLTMKDASLCGLGQTASSAVLSAMKIWPELFRPAQGEME
ncbi:MAG: NAD(P)H-dependent oxidoreductase subunit E [Spirochaetota bacterium]|nr:NAD(P)H-dependent oxidoreductase subunit E [Spirochaetota bacterium]